ncbi:hypothetical protein M1146_00980 [Patescibacteria group bacterium]|nr:hypothetical protein [Patescibacteria group bacterium]
MKKINKILLISVSVIILVTIYGKWFIGKEIIGGDWPYYYKEMLRGFSYVPPLWTSQGGTGLGGVNTNFPFFGYENIIIDIFVNILGLPWQLVCKIFWFGLFIALSVFSMVFLLRAIFKNLSISQIIISIFTYIANSYILLIVGGGQMGIALAYSMAPLVLGFFINLINYVVSVSKDSQSKKPYVSGLRYSIFAGLVFALQLMFDFRISYISGLVVLIYAFFHYFFIDRFSLKLFAFHFLLFIFIVLGFHAFWIIPFLVFRLFSVPEGLTSTSGFEFFSFAHFPQSLSVLHPNWPENIFGKTYFMRVEFLLLPILAFSNLLLLKNLKEVKKNSFIVFFALIALTGAFLVKGINPPFGEVNRLLFNNIPGMNLFRDPTKFYLLITLSYSILIPCSLFQLSKKTQVWIKNSAMGQNFIIKQFGNMIILLSILYLFFLVRPAVFNELGGTFMSHEVPKEYVKLKDFVISQPNFFRTLWIPTQSRFRIQTENHPLINAEWLFKTSSHSATVNMLGNKETEEILEKLAVKYIIIPYDVSHEIFLEDHHYNHAERLKFEHELDKIPWLKKIESGNVSVYGTPKYNERFTLEGEGKLTYKKIGKSKYFLTFEIKRDSKLIFSEQFHPGWIAKINNLKIRPKETELGTMKFDLPNNSQNAMIYFEPEEWMNYSSLFSFIYLVAIIIFLVKTKSGKNV